MQDFTNDGIEIALDPLTKSIARCTQNGDQDPTPIHDLSLFRMDGPYRTNQRHI
jgi:hypothetical protein